VIGVRRKGHADTGISVDQPKYQRKRAAYDNEQQDFDLPDTISRNRYNYTGSDHGPYVDLCSFGKTRMV
jgi:hypothetical protein